MAFSVGITTAQAQSRLRQCGYNELPSAKPRSLWSIAWEVIREPMLLLLVGCSVLYVMLGDLREGLILLSSVTVVIAISFYQSQKTEKALEALKSLSAPRVMVIRDGIETRIPAREVVPGDIVLLHEGDRVGADGIIIDSHNLTIDESILTGESAPVTKEVSGGSASSGKVYSATLVTQGRGRIEVTATGAHTEFGKIGVSLKAIEQSDTPLQLEMKKLISTLFIIGGVLSLLVVAVFYFTGTTFLRSLLNGLAAAMAILPEEFPVILTVFLALGAWRLSKINLLTRKSSAIETLGSATVLCADKTGTITQNKMVVAAICVENSIIPRSGFPASTGVASILRTAANATHEATIEPMEKAISEAYRAIDSSPLLPLVKEYPLSKELLVMTMVRRMPEPETFLASAKGAPEAIFQLCRMSEPEITKHSADLHMLAENGYRVLGVADCIFPSGSLHENQDSFPFRFSGLLAFADPVREEVPPAVEQCRHAGVKVIMITGDFPATAQAIGKQIGLPADGVMLTGDKLNELSDSELDEIIPRVTIFARVVPDQKLRIVRALKNAGEIVAMTGDGVNDAPALKASDIGIAMGKKGTDVAREASSLVLLDDNFASIVAAIRAGRRIFDNLQKAMSYVMAIHIPIIGLTLIPPLISSIPLLLMPVHIVFLELFIDPASSIAFEYEQEERDIMSRSPRDPKKRFFGWNRISRSIFHGSLLLVLGLIIYLLSAREGHTIEESRAITFCSLIIGNTVLILTSLSSTRPFYQAFRQKNYALLIIICSALLMLLLVTTVPFLEHLFSFEFPGYRHFASSFIGAAAVLVVIEVEKWVRRRRLVIND